MVLVPQAQRIGKGGDSPGEREETSKKKITESGGGGRNRGGQISQKRLPNTRIGKIAKMAKSAASLASSGNNVKETLPNPQTT